MEDDHLNLKPDIKEKVKEKLLGIFLILVRGCLVFVREEKERR
jgi:hypothetical protein